MKRSILSYWLSISGGLLLIGIFFGLLGLQTSFPVRQAFAQASPASSCIILGIHPNLGDTPDWPNLDQLESWQGKKNANVTIYVASVSKDLDYTFDQLQIAWNRGNIPNLSLEFWADLYNADNPDNTTIETRIANGELDGYFASFRIKLLDFISGNDKQLNTNDDRRLYLRPAHEANGNWYGWSGIPTDYVKAWRRMHNIVSPGFAKSQLQWIWSVNHNDHGGLTAENYYPGDAYVDWLGIDGYNWGKSYDWAEWNSPNIVFDDMLNRLKVLSPNKPISINEVSTTSVSNGVDAKNDWIASMFEYTHTNNIKMLSWFSKDYPQVDLAIFGGRLGDSVYQNQLVYSKYALSVGDSRVIGSNPNNPRILTDAQFDGSQVCQATLSIKAYLSGAWEIDKMKNLLNTKNLLPKSHPYNLNALNVLENMPPDIVDWLQIDLTTPFSTTSKAALLKSNGQIIEADSSNRLGLNVQPGLTKVTIRHRNHLAITTATDLQIPTSGQINLDMTTNNNVKRGNQATLKPGTFGLKLGNLNGDNVINAKDRRELRIASDAEGQYSSLDINMDGAISSADRVLVRLTEDVAEAM